jgi:argininosuccinate lyase
MRGRGSMKKEVRAKGNQFLSHIIEPELREQSERFFDLMLRINDAHTLMLLEQGLISVNEAKQLLKISRELEKRGPKGLTLAPEKEDLYLNVESHIIEKLGAHIGGKLHTGRSRNDLYATIHRLKCREEVLHTAELLLELRRMLLEKAEDNLNTIIPGYTHMQPAQPITYGHYLSGLGSALKRDFDRLLAAYDRTNVNPLGAGALAGTGFNIDRRLTARYLGFDGVLTNTLDAVASRDYLAEVVSALSIMLSTISRMCHDFYIWVTPEFSILQLPDELVIGSSIMPQKRNPTVFEHIMAKVSHATGAFVSIVTTMKGIPYTHTRGTASEALKLFWKALDETQVSLNVMVAVLDKIRVNKDIALMKVKRNFSTVTEVADEIVRHTDIPFRTAYDIVKQTVLSAYAEGRTSEDLSIDDFHESAMRIIRMPLEGISPRVVKKALDPLENVKRRKSMGGPAPTEVARNLAQMRRELETDVSIVRGKKEGTKAAYDGMRRKISQVIGMSGK